MSWVLASVIIKYIKRWKRHQDKLFSHVNNHIWAWREARKAQSHHSAPQATSRVLPRGASGCLSGTGITLKSYRQKKVAHTRDSHLFSWVHLPFLLPILHASDAIFFLKCHFWSFKSLLLNKKANAGNAVDGTVVVSYGDRSYACDEDRVTYKRVESLCCRTPETNVTFCVNYVQILKKCPLSVITYYTHNTNNV